MSEYYYKEVDKEGPWSRQEVTMKSIQEMMRAARENPVYSSASIAILVQSTNFALSIGIQEHLVPRLAECVTKFAKFDKLINKLMANYKQDRNTALVAKRIFELTNKKAVEDRVRGFVELVRSRDFDAYEFFEAAREVQPDPKKVDPELEAFAKEVEQLQIVIDR